MDSELGCLPVILFTLLTIASVVGFFQQINAPEPIEAVSVEVSEEQSEHLRKTVNADNIEDIQVTSTNYDSFSDTVEFGYINTKTNESFSIHFDNGRLAENFGNDLADALEILSYSYDSNTKLITYQCLDHDTNSQLTLQVEAT